MVFRSGLVFAALSLLAGCGNKGSVSLTGSVSRASVAVEQRTLGTQLTGSFDLFMELGPEAPEGTTVTVQSFALRAASDGAVLVAPLLYAPPDNEFSLGVGQKRTVSYTLDHPDPLPADKRDAICAGDVRIVGALSDTLSGGKTTPVQSAVFTPSGC